MNLEEVRWSLADKAREKEGKAAKTRAQEVRDRLEKEYGITSKPIDVSVSKKEKRKLDRKYKRERQEGFGQQGGKLGVWSGSSRRTH